MKKWMCAICGLIYDEAEGWPDDGIAPGTRWEEVPDDWVCPDCGVGREDFEMLEIDEEEPAAAAAILLATSAVTPAPENSASEQPPIVVVGSGAGYGLVEALRKRDAANSASGGK